MTARAAARTWLRSRRLPVDDAYIEWFTAHIRCTRALRTWNAAGPRVRRAAYRAYLTELEVEEAAARRLERLHPGFAAA